MSYFRFAIFADIFYFFSCCQLFFFFHAALLLLPTAFADDAAASLMSLFFFADGFCFFAISQADVAAADDDITLCWLSFARR
jgi:hypothetical protein